VRRDELEQTRCAIDLLAFVSTGNERAYISASGIELRCLCAYTGTFMVSLSVV
jgi:hypothetical protein